MARALLPEFDRFTQRYGSGAQYEPFREAAPVEETRPSALGGGLRAGFNELQGLGGAAVAATGAAVGSDWLEQAGGNYADRNFAEAQEFGRPDLDVAPWREGGADVLPWLGYQTTKQLPQLAALLAVSRVSPNVAVSAANARRAAMVPRALGGGGLKAGMTAGQQRAALEAGRELAGDAVKMTAAGYPLAVGSMYQEARSREAEGADEATRGDALKAFALGPAYSALEAIQPAQLKGFVKRGGSNASMAKRIGALGLAGAAAEAPVEGAQSALEMSFRPDLTTAEKARQVVDAALTGAAVGGVLGGGAGALRPIKSADPTTITDDELGSVTDVVMSGGQRAVQPGELPLEERPAQMPDLTQQSAEDLSTALGEVDLMMAEGRGTQQDAIMRQALRSELEARETPADNPLAEFDVATLQRMQQQAQAQLEAQPIAERDPEARAMLDRIGQEVAQRTAPQQDPAQPSLFGEMPQQVRPLPGDSAPAQTQATPEVEQQIEATRTMAAQMGGRNAARSRFVRDLQATNDVELAAATIDALEAGESSSAVMSIAERMGIIDAKGETRDLNAELAEAADTRDQRFEVLARTGEGRDQAKAAHDKVTELSAMKARLDAVAEMRAPAPLGLPAPALVTPPPTPEAPVPAPQQPVVSGPPSVDSDGQLALQGVGAPLTREVPQAPPGPEAQPAIAAATADPGQGVLPLTFNAAPSDTSPGALATGLEPVAQQQAVSAARAAEFELAAEQRDAQEAGVRNSRLDAEVAWEQMRPENSPVTLDRLRPDAQRDWIAATRDGTASPELFRTLRQRFKRGRGAPLMEPSEMTVVEDASGRASMVRRSGDEGYDLRMPSGRRTTVKYHRGGRGIEKGWYFSGSLASPETANAGRITLPDGERGPEAAARGAMRMAAERRAPPEAFSDARMMPRAQPTVTRAEVETTIARITKGFPGLDVQVVRSAEDLPTAVAAEVIRDEAENSWGLVRGQTVYILSDNLPTADAAVATFFHEVLGHKGLTRQFGDQLDTALMEIYDNSPALRAQADSWRAGNRAAYKGLSTRERKARSVEEVLARMSENGPVEVLLLDRAARVVRSFARKLGLKVEVSDAEVRAILGAAHAKARGSLKEEVIEGNRYMYVGRGTTQQDPWGLENQNAAEREQQLAEAKLLEATGLPAPQILRRTGWFRGRVDNEWRTEIEDSTARLVDPGEFRSMDPFDKTTLDNVLDHPMLFEAYPELADVEITRRPVPGDVTERTQGTFEAMRNRINVSPYATKDPVEILLHEIQHWVQSTEGFTAGAGRLAGRVFDNMSAAQREWLRQQTLEDITRRKEQLAQVAEGMAAGTPPRGWSQAGDANVTPEAVAASVEQDLEQLIADEQVMAETGIEGGPEFGPEFVSIASRYRGAYLSYLRVAGEIEARETAQRRGLGRVGRRFTNPRLMEPGIENDAINVGSNAGRDPRLQDPEMSLAAPVAEASKRVQQASRLTDKMVERLKKVDLGNAGPTWRRLALYATTLGHIVDRSSKMFSGTVQDDPKRQDRTALQRYLDAHQRRVTLSQRWSQLAMAPMHSYEKLKTQDNGAAERVRRLMGMSAFQIDPRRSWKEHDWLHGTPLESTSFERHTQAVQDYEWLRQNTGPKAAERARRGKKTGVSEISGTKAYEDFVAVNEAQHAAHQTMSLYNLAHSNLATRTQILGSSPVDPMVGFLDDKNSRTPAQARDFWRAEREALMKSVGAFLERQRGYDVTAIPSGERRAYENHTSSIEARYRQIVRDSENVNKAPYFHLGRFGDHFVAFYMPSTTNADGRKVVDQKAISRVAKALEAEGFNNVVLQEGIEKPHAFVRLENETQQENLYRLVRKMHEQGMLDPDTPPIRGKRGDPGETIPTSYATEISQRFIEYVGASTAFDPDPTKSEEQNLQLRRTKDALISMARDFALDVMPDTSSAKVMVHRETVPGYSDDMVQSYAFRSEIGGQALANMSTMSEVVESFSSMKGAVNDAKSDPDANVNAMHDVVNELAKREQERPRDQGFNWSDKLRAINHAYFLGMSPAYVLTNLTQISVLLWPELSKKHGFAKTARTIYTVTPTAWKVVTAVMSAGWQQGGHRWVDYPITAEVLENSGVDDKATRDFVMRIVNTGVIDIGSASREHGRIAEGRTGSKLDMTLRYASAAGLYSEMFSRLVAALSARELNGRNAPEAETLKYSVDVVNQAMLNYSAYNIARATGKGGPAAELTPVALSFMQYSFQVMEKLYREIHTVVTKDASPEQKREAQRFLGSHLTAVTVLAGSLGMPGAAFAARAVEELVGVFGDEEDQPFDAVIAWRNFLTDTFGEQTAEIIARGVPRALGFDVSTRVGEQALLPFSRMVQDKREIDVVIKETAFRAFGSPLSMVTNVFTGASAMAKGDIMGGMQTMVPVALKGPTKAYNMTAQGYTDNRGNVLPMTPGASDYLTQLIGFTPSELAEYNEARFSSTVRRSQLSREAANIRQRLVVAIERDDKASAQKWLQRAREFGTAHPAFDVLERLPDVLQRRSKARAMSAATGTPINTRMDDTSGVDQLRFAPMQ